MIYKTSVVMAIVLASSVSSSLNSVILCCTTDTTDTEHVSTSWQELFLMFCSGVPRSATAKDAAGVVKFEENTLAVMVFGFP
jgi:hypothetical protein